MPTANVGRVNSERPWEYSRAQWPTALRRPRLMRSFNWSIDVREQGACPLRLPSPFEKTLRKSFAGGLALPRPPLEEKSV